MINKTNTRLDTNNLTLWREAGLIVNEQASMMPSNREACRYLEEGDGVTREELMGNALVWLMAKLANFMAVDRKPSYDGVLQRTLLDQWFDIRKQFQIWHEDLPATFKPLARVASSQTFGQTPNNDSISMFTEIWYSVPMYASTMQTYHMSQILLLMNKPHEPALERNTVVTRMSYCQSDLVTCQNHSHSIVGISLARPNKAVRIHSVQPLFTAGQCLSDDRERRIVLRLLKNIESETGCATAYRMQQLAEQWQGEE